jgi:hypothetical protein
MPSYPPEHLADIHYVYGFCDGNSLQAVAEYRRRYPDRRIPHHSTFTEIHRQFREKGLGKINRERAINLDIQTENRIMNLITEDPTLSSKAVARMVNVNYRLVLKLWKRYGLHPFHYRKVQGLINNDGLARVAFCQRMTQKLVEDPGFLNKILWTDESLFTREGVFNSHNQHMWLEENPHAKRENSYQHKFSVNLWAGIIGNKLIGPVIFPNRLNSENYLHFLNNELRELLEDIDLETRRTMWYQHDGCPAHFGLAVRNWLNEQYPARWIGRGSNVLAWPARSPDLTPLDFFLWGTLKDKVYKTPVNTREELLGRIRITSEEIKNTFVNLNNEIRLRLNLCAETGGTHFENLIH